MPRLSLPVVNWLDGAAEAARKARRDPSDAVALHDFRINVRRLIVYAKIVEKPCGIPRKLRKRLRRALSATGRWRDAHVEKAWMADFARRRSGGRGADSFARAFYRHCAPHGAERSWWREVEETLSRLRRAVEARSPRKRDLHAAQCKAASKEWRRLRRRLRGLDTASGRADLHKARIAAKNLRYILEALGPTPRGFPSPAALRGLQTALGDAHDRDVIAEDVAAAGRAAALAAPRRSALARLARERRQLLIGAKPISERLLAERG